MIHLDDVCLKSELKWVKNEYAYLGLRILQFPPDGTPKMIHLDDVAFKSALKLVKNEYADLGLRDSVGWGLVCANVGDRQASAKCRLCAVARKRGPQAYDLETRIDF